MKKIKESEKTVEHLTAEKDAELFKELWRKEEGRTIELEQKIKNLQTSISSLKSDLSTALNQVSRQQGYLDRVREDDIVNDGGATIQEQFLESRSREIRRGPSSYANPVLEERLYSDYQAGSPGVVTKVPKPWWDR